MKNAFVGFALAIAMVSGAPVEAQDADLPSDAPAAEAGQPLYAPQQLDQLLASIALYPDPLLTVMLTVATYPLEVVEADRWVSDSQNAALRYGALAMALQSQSWDPSVKSLVPFPQILNMMDTHLDWTQAIGNAFLAQQADVMDSVQRLRHEAMAAGTLRSNPEATVVVDGPYIQIEPANPQVVYIPVYNSGMVYGPWPYPADPPIYYGPPPGVGFDMQSPVIGFAGGIVVVEALWNWGHSDWRGHRIDLDRDRFDRINAGRPPGVAAVWQHDPQHRHAVPYLDPASRARFERPPAVPPQLQSAPPQLRPASLPQSASPTARAVQQERRTDVPTPHALLPPSGQPSLPQVGVPPVGHVPQPPATGSQGASRGVDAPALSQRGQESGHAPPQPIAQPQRQQQNPVSGERHERPDVGSGVTSETRK